MPRYIRVVHYFRTNLCGRYYSFTRGKHSIKNPLGLGKIAKAILWLIDVENIVSVGGNDLVGPRDFISDFSLYYGCEGVLITPVVGELREARGDTFDVIIVESALQSLGNNIA